MAIAETRRHRPRTAWFIWQGVIGGIIAGLVFAVFEMAQAALLTGVTATFMPLRLIGAIALGPAALDPNYPLVMAALVGVLVHLVLSAVFGAIFGAIVAAAPRLAVTTTRMLVTASVYGLALWLINFYILAPIFTWNWFPSQTNPLVQVIAHTFFFGTVLGFYLDRVSSPRWGARTLPEREPERAGPPS